MPLGNLKKYRQRAGYTQAQAAERIGKSDTMIHRYEAGKSKPDSGVLENLAKVYGCKVGEFFTDSGPGTRLDRNALSIAVREVLWCIERLESSMAETEAVSCVLEAYGQYRDQNIDDREKFSAIAEKIVLNR